MSELELRKKAAMKELAEILDWVTAEERKVYQKRQPIYGNKGDFAYIHQEMWRRIRELKAKYQDLPPDTKINFKERS